MLILRQSTRLSRFADKHKKRQPQLSFLVYRNNDYDMCWPPLIEIFAPVTNAASSEAR